jgi:hypothetical protein
MQSPSHPQASAHTAAQAKSPADAASVRLATAEESADGVPGCGYLVTGDDFSTLRLFNYPAVWDDAPYKAFRCGTVKRCSLTWQPLCCAFMAVLDEQLPCLAAVHPTLILSTNSQSKGRQGKEWHQSFSILLLESSRIVDFQLRACVSSFL